MSIPMIREKVITAIDHLNDEQLETVYSVIQSIQSVEEDQPDYDPDNDPAIGFITGPTDLSERVEEILQEEIDAASGWTQKGKNPL
jgi:uroporphyrinogen-III decarboxylase